MKLHTVFISYNRGELLEKAMVSYFETVTVPFHVTVVDNDSDWETRQWVGMYAAGAKYGMRYAIAMLDQNYYPGYAANFAWDWEMHLGDTHLHRADNDWEFLPGWCEEVERCFSENPRLGQLGMRTNEQEGFNARNVGGNCIITRQIWDEGLRYDERPWPQIKAAGYTEDSYMSPKVLKMGWEWGRVRSQCIESLADEDPHDPYYRKSWEDRKILKQSLKAYGIEE